MKLKYLLLALIALLPCLAHADEASHRAAAIKLLDTLKAKETMRAAFMTYVDTMPAGANTTPAELADVKQAMADWFDKDFKWEDLQSKLADIYEKNFSEEELNQLAAFYQTPLGQKTLNQLPQAMKDGAQIGQQYAASKQGALVERLQKVHDKFHPAPAATAPAAGTAK